MGIRKQLSQYASRRITRRLYRTMPWVGSLLAIVTLGKAVRRKGVIGGTVHTALDFIPFVGGVKNLAILYGQVGFRNRAVELWQRGLSLAPDEETRSAISEHLAGLLSQEGLS